MEADRAMDPNLDARGPDQRHLTSIHVRRARDGDGESTAWLVDRFAPALLAQARYRLRQLPAGLYDPEDLVQDAWMAAIPGLPDLDPHDGRLTPVLMRYLSTALVNRANTLLQKHVMGKPLREAAPGVLAERRADLTGAVTRVLRSEAHGALQAAIDRLDPGDREIVILRGIEQNRNETVAALLGLRPNTVAVRYRRALAELRRFLSDTVFDDLD
jgi:RNA polymerase sigma-70 factor (ECF subfamily)